MADTTFRTKITPEATSAEADVKAVKSDTTPSSLTDNVPVPYTEYSSKNGRPYIVDYYQIGDTWRDSVGGFETEVNTLDMYLRDKIESGLMDNSTEAVKEAIKKIEKMCGVNKEDRTVNKIAKISAYAEFLLKTRKL